MVGADLGGSVAMMVDWESTIVAVVESCDCEQRRYLTILETLQTFC